MKFIFYYVSLKFFCKYTWVVSIKDKKSITITNAFQKTLDESKNKSNQVWVDKESEF